MFSEVVKKCFEVLMSVKFEKIVFHCSILKLELFKLSRMHVESRQWFKGIMLSQLYLKILPSIDFFKDCDALSLSSFVLEIW